MQPPQNPYNQPNYEQPGYGAGRPRGTVSLDVISEAWNIVKPSLGQWIAAFLIIGVVAFVMGLVFMIPLRLFMPAPGQQPGAGFFLAFLALEAVAIVVMTALSAGLIKMAITQTRTGVLSLGEITNVGDVVVPIIIASILVGIVTSIGSMLCVIPGIIAALGLCMVQPLIIDQKISAVDAMKRSWAACQPNLGSIFVLGLVLWLLNMAGALVCGLGVFVTYPISIVALALVYRDLFGAGGTPTQNTGYTPPPIANPNF